MPRQHRPDTVPVRCTYAAEPRQRPRCQLTATVRYGATPLCATCQPLRSTIGKGQPAKHLPPQPPLDLLAWLRDADEQLRTAHAELTAAAQRAHAHGHSWASIGHELNITRQAAQQRFRQDQNGRG